MNIRPLAPRMIHLIQVLPLVAVLVIEPGLAGEAADPVEVRLEVSAPEVLRHDHVLVKIVLTNRLISQVQLSDYKNRKHLGFVLDMKRDQGAWERVPLNGRVQKEFFEENKKIPGGESYAVFGHVFLFADGRFVFEKAGNYELRAAVTTAIGELVSPPIPFQIHDMTVRQDRDVEKLKDKLNMSLLTMGATDLDEGVGVLAAKLDSCEIKQTLVQTRLIAEFLRFRTFDDKGITFPEALDRLTAKQSPVRKDYIHLALALGMARQRKWSEASQVVSLVAENSETKTAVIDEIVAAVRRGER